MSRVINRREFLLQGALTAASLPFLSLAEKNAAGNTNVPGIKIGYAAITWGGNDAQAIKDIAGAGFKGIQLRSNTVKTFGSKPAELLALLEQYHLALPMFSSGNANINTGDDEAVIKMHLDNARFVKSLKGNNMQITNSSRPKEGKPSEEDLQKFGKLLNEIGKRTLDIGVTTNYHNHMNQLGQTPGEVEIILGNCDSRYVEFLLDIAHYQQGGGDPVKAVGKYKDRIKSIHLKDVRPVAGADAKHYQFVELGQGTVDLPGVFKALNDIRFKGWGIVELDAVPAKEKTPLQCAGISKAYLQSQGIKI